MDDIASDGNGNDCDNHWGWGQKVELARGDARDAAIVLAIKL